MDGKEKVQIYASYTDSRTVTPICQLCGVKSVELKAGEKAELSMKVDKYWLRAVLPDGTRSDADGSLCFYVGGQQPDKVSAGLRGAEPIRLTVR